MHESREIVKNLHFIHLLTLRIIIDKRSHDLIHPLNVVHLVDFNKEGEHLLHQLFLAFLFKLCPF